MNTCRWVCQACEHVNAPELSKCEQCTCSAGASAMEVEKVKLRAYATEIREFFTTSTFKLVVMSLSTFSLYLIYWFYRNWRLIKKQTPKSKMMPVLRALFSPLFAYSCFRYIQFSASRAGVNSKPHIGYLALAFFVLHLMGNLPNFYSLIGFLTFLPIVPMNNLALAVNREHNRQFQNNDQFSVLNKVVIFIGASLWLISIIGMIIKPSA